MHYPSSTDISVKNNITFWAHRFNILLSVRRAEGKSSKF
ncbi:hypothetical protein PFWH6_4067 [Pseudomonas fluorescens WH6]|nr:hypothetical protein PFWH6_4067 [Pseudomonas fluorescens WH6]